MSRDELLKIRNFGEKSYSELYDKLRDNDLLPADLDPDRPAAEHEEEEAETATEAAGAVDPQELV
jgi:DNA-directed RNA polymerase alpha subunit